MQTDFLSIGTMIVSALITGTFLMHRIRNALTNRVLKKSLSDQGTCLPIRQAVTYVYSLPLPSVVEHLAQPIA
jgi:small-conductance mechanosensitive channel